MDFKQTSEKYPKAWGEFLKWRNWIIIATNNKAKTDTPEIIFFIYFRHNYHPKI